MCGRYTLVEISEHLQIRFSFEDIEIVLDPRYNIAPTQDAPVLILRADTRVLTSMRWGLVPSWAKDKSIGNRMINARAETLAEKPSFKRAFASRRCLIPADGFYEWRKGFGKRKTPMRFVLRDREPFAFAGLWERWRGGGGDLCTFTIITTSANELIEPVHHRMPAILKQEDENEWLDPEAKPDRLPALLAPYPADRMEAYDVSTVVNAPVNDSPACIEPV